MGANRQQALTEAAAATLGTKPAVHLLFDTDLAAKFRDRCRWERETAVADLLFSLQRPEVLPARANTFLFSKNTKSHTSVPAGSEHAIEWALVRLWCESVRRPDNVLDLLAEDGAAARFLAMTRRPLAIALSGTRDDLARAEQAVWWAVRLQERRDGALRNEFDREQYRDEGRSPLALPDQRLRHLDRLDDAWREVGRDPVGQRRESGLVRVMYAGEVAWVGFVSSVPLSLMAVMSDGTLGAAASRGWWDLRPSLLRMQFMGVRECKTALADSTSGERVPNEASRKTVLREQATAAEAALIVRDRPFLNLPFWPRTGEQRRY